MRAYSVPLKTTCDQQGCDRLATEEVFNAFNAPLGKFCARHAQQLVKGLPKGER